MYKLCQNAGEAVSCVKSGNRIFIHGQMATPLRLIEGLVQRAKALTAIAHPDDRESLEREWFRIRRG